MQRPRSTKCRVLNRLTSLILATLAAFSCKHAGSNSDTKVIGGSKASEPYGFFVTLKKTSADRVRCGGARISRNVVVTAAHCVWDLGFEDRITAAIGPTRLSQANNGKQFQVKQIIVHPEYNADQLVNDIALIELADDPDLDQSEDYVELVADQSLGKPGEQLLVIGFGKQTTHGELIDPDSDFLQVAEVPVIRQDVCAALNTKSYEDLGIPSQLTPPIQATQLCAGFPRKGKVDSCQGDSGGPLLRKKADGSYQLIGIVSRGMASTCASIGTTGVYASLAAYRDWIESVLIDGADPLSKDNLAERAQYVCYNALNSIKTAEKIRVQYRYDHTQTSPWQPEDAALWADKNRGYSCDETVESGIKLKLYPAKDVFDPPFALLEGTGNLRTKVSYRPQSITAFGGDNFIQYSIPLKTVFGSIDRIPMAGKPLSSTPTKVSTKTLELSQGKFASNYWTTDTNQKFVEIRYAEEPIQYFEALAPKIDRDPEVYIEKETNRLVIKNLSSNQIVSWNFTCPSCFSLKSTDGDIYKAEAFTSEKAKICGISARYPTHNLAVIPANTSLSLELQGFKGDITECRWNQLKLSIK